jgi:hypothetical protein
MAGENVVNSKIPPRGEVWIDSVHTSVLAVTPFNQPSADNQPHWCEQNPESLYRTGGLGEDGVRVGANKPNGSHHDYKDRREHDSVFCDVLAFVV